MRVPVRFVLGAKNLYLFIISTLFLLYGIYTYFDEVRFYFHDAPPVDLGDALDADGAALAKVEDGDYVTVRGIRSLQGGVIEEGFSQRKHLVYFFLGSSRFVVTEPMAAEEEKNAGGVRVTLTGRIYGFKTNALAAKYRAFFDNRYALMMAEDGWLVRAGHAPHTDHGVVALYAVLLLLLIANVLLAVRTLRPRSSTDDDLDDFDDDGEDQ